MVDSDKAVIEQFDERERHLLTLEALADVDAGQLIDHDWVVAWATALPVRRSP